MRRCSRLHTACMTVLLLFRTAQSTAPPPRCSRQPRSAGRWRGCGGAGHLLLPLPPRPLPLPPRPLPLPLLPPQPRPGPGPRHEYLVKWMSSGTARRLRPSPAATSASACPAPASVACAPRWVIRFQGLNFPIYLFSLETAPHEATPLHLAPTPHVHPTPWGGSPTPRRTLVSRF